MNKIKNSIISALILASSGLTQDKNPEFALCDTYSQSVKEQEYLKQELDEAMNLTVEWYNEQGIPTVRKEKEGCHKISFEGLEEILKSNVNITAREHDIPISMMPFFNKEYNKKSDEVVNFHLDNKDVVSGYENIEFFIKDFKNDLTNKLAKDNKENPYFNEENASWLVERSFGAKSEYDPHKDVVRVNTFNMLLQYVLHQEQAISEDRMVNSYYASEELSFAKDVALTLVHEIGHSLNQHHLNYIFDELESNRIPLGLRQELGCVNFMSYNNPTVEDFKKNLGVEMSTIQEEEILKRLKGEEIPSYEKMIGNTTLEIPKYLRNVSLKEYVCD